MASLEDIPMDSPLRKYAKRDLPQSLASTYPHGHISGRPRSPQAQRAFNARKAAILRTMDAEQIEAAYQENVAKVVAILEADRKKNEEIDREVDKLKAQKQLETKIAWKRREEKAIKDRNKEATEAEDEDSEL
jgi:hypothetical protein